MIDDAGCAQARALLKELMALVAKISHELDVVERRGHHASARGAVRDRRQQSELRRELYEAHRLIDGLHRRYPETVAYPYRRVQPTARV